MITVHHLNNSRSQRVLWLLEELGLPYEIKRYERDPKTMLAPASLRKVHPLGKSPVITDGELTLAESGAIVEYLVRRYGNGRLIPALDTPEQMTQILEEPSTRQTLNQSIGISENIQFILRTGYLKNYPEPVSLRRPVEWFIRS